MGQTETTNKGITVKRCSKCNLEKSKLEFSSDGRNSDGLYYCCKACRKSTRKDYNKSYRTKHRSENKDQIKIYQVWFLYKLTEDQYLDMIKDGCWVCGSINNLCVDHDHSCCSGKSSCGNCVRGILCRPCNQAEGFLKSDPARVRKLAEYLER